jgi:nucleoside-diphosphate-sugar epimerase
VTRLAIVGCGYTGSRLGLQRAPHHEVIGCVRSEASVSRLNRAGLRSVLLDLDTASRWPLEAAQSDGAAIGHFVPPPRTGPMDLRTARLLEILPGTPSVFLYLSTTGVYGDHGGGPVDELTPIAPMTDRARRRADAESRVTTWCDANGVRAVILRVPGIYGPGRLPLARLERGDPVVGSGKAGRAGNRIHVDDLVGACELVLTHPGAHGIYNVGDGDHSSPADFMRLVARLAELPEPRSISFEAAQHVLSAEMLSYARESRRVATDRIRTELGFVPRYTNLEAGIRASLEERRIA